MGSRAAKTFCEPRPSAPCDAGLLTLLNPTQKKKTKNKTREKTCVAHFSVKGTVQGVSGCFRNELVSVVVVDVVVRIGETRHSGCD